MDEVRSIQWKCNSKMVLHLTTTLKPVGKSFLVCNNVKISHLIVEYNTQHESRKFGCVMYYQ